MSAMKTWLLDNGGTATKEESFSDVCDQAAAALSLAIGKPVIISPEDRLRGAIVEACQWIRQQSSHRALETLESALNRK